MLKKAGIAAGIATAALLALTPLAFAHDEEGGDASKPVHFQILPGVQDRVIQHPVKECNKAILESEKNNTDSHHGDCDQDISPSDEWDF